MNVIARLAALLLIFTLLTSPAVAQKRQTPARPQPKTAPAPAPAPTFDSLVPADTYVIYGEVRDAGQLIRSSAINDLLAPILKLAGPSKEFKSVVKWLNAHADQAMSSRLLVATSPVNRQVPETLVAIEFASPEEAAKFTTPLNEFLPTVLPTPMPEPSTKNAPPPKPPFHLERLGSLVVISPRPWTMKQLRPTGSKALADDPNFRTARNRFNSESLFAYVDIKLMDKEEEERRKQAEAERQKVEEQAKQNAEKPTPDPVENQEPPDAEKAVPQPEIVGTVRTLSVGPPKEAPTPDPISAALTSIGNSFFGGETHMPDAVALALSFEGESFDLRGLLIKAPGETSDALPFWPNIIPGIAIAPEAPNIFPSNTELFATMALDLPQIFAVMSKPKRPEFTVARGRLTSQTRVDFESPFKPIEKKLDISIENDLLPLLGSEVAIGLPMQGLNFAGLGPPPANPEKDPEKKENENAPEQAVSTHAPILAISVKDKERLRALLPKLIETLGFKGASSFAATERREDTELISYADLFAYAFVGDFLVLSTDAATTRHVVDSYLKHETLASDTHYRAYTRWQSRQLQGQLYISPSLMESYRTWATQSMTTRMGDQMQNFLATLGTVAQPITYSLSNEGLGPLHELHIPKNLVAMLVTGISGELNPPPLVQNERLAIGLMYQIVYAEEQYKSKNGAGNYGSLEDLIAADLFSKDMLEKSGYKFDVIINGDKLEVSAVPTEYGKTGSLSLFLDQARVLRGGDRNGAAATAADPPFPN
jgi:Protein of unknown function (DUF3352)